jgi:hypothetical protein
MDTSTGSWFEYLREEVLTEGLRDIGLPESIIDFIEDGMPNAPEKSKMYAGNEWKKWTLNAAYRDRYIDEVWHKFMLRNFRHQIQLQGNSEQERRGLESLGLARVQARTVAPYDERGMEDSPPEQRVKYDDETIEQNKRIAFVVQNVANVVAKPLGTWRKSFAKAVKALSKAGLPSEKVETVKNELDRITIGEFRTFWNRFDTLFSWLNDEPTNYELIKGEENIFNAETTAQEELNNQEDPSQIIHQFDDGYYWYNLETSNCTVEGERMGHCGSDTRGVLVSLRKRKGKRRASSSYITMTWSDDTLYQIKGRSNEAPVEDSWPYIDWFVKNMDIQYIHETGEHANSTWEFQEMNDYLRNENPGVSIAGNAESMMEDAVEAIDQLNREFDDLENCSVWFDEPEDYGMGEDALYSRASAECVLQIDLGWKGFVKEGEEYRPTMGTEGQARYEPDKRIAHNIPVDSYTGDSRDFRSELDVESVLDLPGEDVEIDYEVKMLTGAQPEGTELDPDYPQTAHLEITARPYESFRIWSTGMDNIDVDEMEYFGSQIRDGFEEDASAHQEVLRARLSEEGYALKSDWDRQKDDFGQMSEEGLENFYVDIQDTAAQFWFRDGPGGNIANDWGGNISIDVPLYLGTDARAASARGVPRWLTDAFGTPKTYSGWGRDPFFENETLNKQMARQLAIVSAQAQSRDRNQLDLPLGKEYEWKPVEMALANDTRFLVFVNTKHDMHNLQKLPVTTINWRLLIKADSKDNAEEFEIVKEIVKLLNKSPDLVKKAANDILDMRMEPVEEHAERMKAALLGGNTAMTVIRSLDSAYGASATSGDTRAERIIMIAKWIQDNWEKMDEVQKYVAQTRFLRPMNNRQFRTYNEEGQIEMDDPNNLGKPVVFDEYVAAELQRRGAAPSQMRNYTGGLSEQIESVEDQIAGIDKALNEDDPNYDLRIYKIEANVSIQKDVGGEIQETQTEIRGIEGVTTVRTIGNTVDTGTSTVATYEIKFELLGAIGRVKYRDRILIPGLMKIRGLKILKISPVHRTNARGTIRTVRESQDVWSMNQTNLSFNTPRPSLKDAVADWAEGGVMDYDTPMDANNMRYHVMMPVSELTGMLSSPRAPEDVMDGRYQDFIKNGATMPVYIAIGMNGVAKITGNEDIVHHAVRSGLEEVPVFLSYQRQV